MRLDEPIIALASRGASPWRARPLEGTRMRVFRRSLA
jgi:hypothetical protein